MTTHLTVDELESTLVQARHTADYLIADVVRLKDELQEVRTENHKLKEQVRELEQKLTPIVASTNPVSLLSLTQGPQDNVSHSDQL